MSDSLTLNIHSEGDITIPGEVANSTLSLHEIGALVCFVAATSGETEVSPERINSPTMQAAISSLKEKNVISVRMEGKTLKINVDIEPVLPAVDDADVG